MALHQIRFIAISQKKELFYLPPPIKTTLSGDYYYYRKSYLAIYEFSTFIKSFANRGVSNNYFVTIAQLFKQFSLASHFIFYSTLSTQSQ